MDLELANQACLDVSHKVAAIAFRHYTAEEVAKLSVCTIKRERAFDDLGRPVPNGLYDARLGVTAVYQGVCTSCKQDYFRCPGHFGHIELPFPAVNPSCFKIVNRILMNTCWECRRYRMENRNRVLLLALLRFEHAGRHDCANTTRYWMCTVGSGKYPARELELMKETFPSFFRDLPDVIKKRAGEIDPQTVLAESFDSVLAEAAKEVWEEAARKKTLANHPTPVWQEMVRIFERETTKKCVDCGALQVKVKVNKNRIFVKYLSKNEQSVIFPGQIHELIKDVWENDKELFALLYGQAGRISDDVWESLDHNVFFIQNVLVPPSRFRPSQSVGESEMATEHPQNIAFTSILEGINMLADIADEGNENEKNPMESAGNAASDSDSEMSDDIQTVNGKTEKEKRSNVEPLKSLKSADLPNQKNRRIGKAIQQMQKGLCQLYDNQPTKLTPFAGVRQQLEAKQGLFRMHMMGKRVNFSCRSVIGPDLFLETNEVGIPESFAKRLTVPEYVTSRNLREMQTAVLNGPNKYPGAVCVDKWTADGHYRRIKLRAIAYERQGIADSLLSDKEQTLLPSRVLRHVKSGDVVLFNRQPTLHRVSIMAQKVRVLPGDRTIRFHYANCKSYNADFDGDEMNVHVLQDHLSQAEAKELMMSSKHYIAPTSGEPVRGLIQDHVAAAAVLSNKDTWMDRQRFCQLLYEATSTIVERKGYRGGAFRIPEPAIIKPRNLWSGKQLISALLNIIRGDKPGLNLVRKSKTSAKIVGREESVVIIRNGEFLRGTFDKSSIGASVFGAIHGIQEVYGNEASDDFLGAFGKLGTFYLRNRGHSTGIEDLLLRESAEEDRRNVMMSKLNEIAIKATNEVYDSFGTDAIQSAAKSLDEARRMTEEMIYVHGDKAEDSLDTAMKSALNGIQSEVTNSCLPNGLRKSYPLNGFALMTTTGAKGSDVNSAQISCLVGSTSLEGKRVPRMGGCGATLPCFEPYDASPNAGGFIASRFLTGIKPYEFFFHAMAGREGLLDTSLKTANSGYLQRCLIKAMEGIKLDYDYTVRDSDGKVIQFLYGDDGLDPCKCRFLTERTSFQVENMDGLQEDRSKRDPRVKALLETSSKRKSTILEELSPGAFSKNGAVSEKFRDKIMDYLRTQRSSEDDIKAAKKKEREITRFLESRYQRCTVEPGEPVGVIAAQGVGEPSTQMTLNTFHHAGSSSAHVTLGIPRLRELLMRASKYPKTPSMTLPILPEHGKEGAERMVKTLKQVHLIDLLDAVELNTVNLLNAKELGNRLVALVKINLKFPKPDVYDRLLGVSFDELFKTVEKQFQSRLVAEIKKQLKSCIRMHSGTPVASELRSTLSLFGGSAAADDEDGDDGEEEGEGNEKETQQDKDFIANEVENKDKSDDEMDGKAEKEENESSSSDSSESDSESGNESGGYDDGEKEEDGNKSSDTDEDEVKELQDEQMNGVSEEVDTEKENEEKANEEKANGIESAWCLGPFSNPEVGEDRTNIWLPWVLPASMAGRIRIPQIIREIAKDIKIREIERIGRCFMNEEKGEYQVITEGSNLLKIFELGPGIVDFDRMMTNDMYGILMTYGVEAMRLALIQEFEKVFDAYGIPVNIRHLQLIADYMTQEGGYRGFNRVDIAQAPSTFQKITFETSVKFLSEAVMYGTRDNIDNPSAAIAVNATYRGGTGSVDLVTKL